MDYKAIYKKWKEFAADEQIAAELVAMRGDEKEIESRFSGALEFGTAGMRAKIGAGTNRMNIYTVQMATQGIADYLNAKGGKSMAIPKSTTMIEASDSTARTPVLLCTARVSRWTEKVALSIEMRASRASVRRRNSRPCSTASETLIEASSGSTRHGGASRLRTAQSRLCSSGTEKPATVRASLAVWRSESASR